MNYSLVHEKPSNAGLQLRRGEKHPSREVRNYLRSMLSRRQLQGFVRRDVEFKSYFRYLIAQMEVPFP